MKKIFPIVVVGLFLLSVFGANAIQIEKTDTLNETIILNDEEISQRGTHTPLAEYATATWCSPCHYAHGALKELYAEGQLDFYYVTYVCDMNPTGYSHCNGYYNFYGYPTVWWDGGYKVNVGASSVPGAKSTYTSSINQCGARAVKDVDIDLAVDWLGGTQMEIECTITNNEGSIYGGHVRVFICEKVSSMGWSDTSGQLYTMPFLDWAFNEPLSISSGGSWNDIMTWDGASNGFPTITEGNIIVIAAVYNDEWHQGYSYTPPQNPFDAYYVDECVAVDLGAGTRPDKPIIDGPTSGIVGLPYGYTASTTDPDDDDLFYNVDWDDGTTSGWIGPYPSGDDAYIENIWENPGSYDVKVQAKDSKGLISEWSDPISVIIENNAPNAPVVTGPTSGSSGTAYIFTFNSLDPNDDDVYYYIEWGDGEITDWHGPYGSGLNHNKVHTFHTTGTFTIEAKAKDVHGSESAWGTLEVTMPRDKSVKSIFLNFLESHPNLFPILQLILQQIGQ